MSDEKALGEGMVACCGQSDCHRCYGDGERPGSWYELDCPCSRCDRKGAEERYSLGIYAGRYCLKCWRESGYRDEPASAFDPGDAGESYEEVG